MGVLGSLWLLLLTQWGWVTHICISDLTVIIGSDNGWLAPRHYQNQCWNIVLTHWGWVTHKYISDLTAIIGSDNGLSPGRRQAIIRTNARILLIRPLRTNFSEILIEILIFSFKKMHLKVSSAKRWSFCLGINVLIVLSPQWDFPYW